MVFFLSFNNGYVLILGEYQDMVACCDLVSILKLKPRQAVRSHLKRIIYYFQDNKLVQLDRDNYFRQNIICFAQVLRERISWDFDKQFGQKCVLNGTKFCENCQNSDLHWHN